jgi:hypothetical protein
MRRQDFHLGTFRRQTLGRNELPSASGGRLRVEVGTTTCAFPPLHRPIAYGPVLLPAALMNLNMLIETEGGPSCDANPIRVQGPEATGRRSREDELRPALRRFDPAVKA